GKMKWKETVNANWKRARRRASNWSNMLLVLGVFATAFLRTRHDEEAIFHLQDLLRLRAQRQELDEALGIKPLHVGVPASQKLEEIVHLAHAFLSMTLLHAGGLLHEHLAQQCHGRVDRAFLALLDERADDLPDVVRGGEVVAPIAGLVLEPHQV